MPSTTPFLLVALAVLVLAGCRAAPSPGSPAEARGGGALGPGLHLRELPYAGATRRATLYVPPGEPPAEGWPLVVFLHGSGERGDDGLRPAAVGLFPAVLFDSARWPAVIAMPQIPEGARWTAHTELVAAAVRDAESAARIDPRRRVLTGLSNGGQGTWAAASAHPELWAAIAPVCGFAGGDPATLATLPVWAFHGEKDDVVKPEETRGMIARIEAAGGRPRVTYFPDANHNAWDPTYRGEQGEQLARWLLAARRAP